METKSRFDIGEFEGIDLILCKGFDDVSCCDIAGLANVRGGYIVVGVDDFGSVIGVSLEEIENGLHSLSKSFENLTKQIFLSSEIKTIGKTNIVLIKIEQSQEIPVLVKRDDGDSLYLFENGRTTWKPDSCLEEPLFGGRRCYFEAMESQTSLEQCSFFDLSKEMKRPLTKEALLEMGLVTKNGFLTNAGLLFADETTYKNSCFIIAKENKSGRFDTYQKISGNLFVLLQKARELIEKRCHPCFAFTSTLEEIKVTSFPLEEAFKAFILALVHRDYFIDPYQNSSIFRHGNLCLLFRKTCLEIVVPGKKKGKDKPSEFFLPNTCRNPIALSILKEAGYLNDEDFRLKSLREFYRPFEKCYQPTIDEIAGETIIRLYDLSYSPYRKGKGPNGDYFLRFVPPKKGKRMFDEIILRHCLEESLTELEIAQRCDIYYSPNFYAEFLLPLIEKGLLQVSDDRFSTNPEKVKLFHKAE